MRLLTYCVLWILFSYLLWLNGLNVNVLTSPNHTTTSTTYTLTGKNRIACEPKNKRIRKRNKLTQINAQLTSDSMTRLRTNTP
ncbi:hypothetical protein [Spirosoma validum]|uniref:Uncharacterized protein n=1 Tax=Spirosoma validum TaxID=2771355 RepID=A0A927GEN2_9BACT|nr:hypothetical protein [Spirosoma validum]MBD2754974.1 hypothetical protein [Spirosoma validum]